MREAQIIIFLLTSAAAVTVEQYEFLPSFLKAGEQEQTITTLLMMQKHVHTKNLLQGLYP